MTTGKSYRDPELQAALTGRPWGCEHDYNHPAPVLRCRWCGARLVITERTRRELRAIEERAGWPAGILGAGRVGRGYMPAYRGFLGLL